MLLPTLLTVAALWIVGIVVTLVHIRRAPVAVEDASGFHIIEDPEADKIIELREALRAH